MRILILGTARSGTTSLLLALGKDNIRWRINEPFLIRDEQATHRIQSNKVKVNERPMDYPLEELSATDTCCVKSIVGQIPLIFEYKRISKLEQHKNFISDFSTYFDKIILLDRRNTEEHWFSMLNLLRLNHINPNNFNPHLSKYGDNWNNFTPFKKWYREDIPEGFDLEMRNAGEYDLFIESKKLLKQTSELLNLPIFYYEDLYSTNKNTQTKSLETLCLYLDNIIELNTIKKKLSPTKRLLQSGSKPLL